MYHRLGPFMDRFLLDGHKLIYHPDRVASWLRGERIFPIYVEIGPINRCNYRCSFCAIDYTGYNGPVFPVDAMKRLLSEMKESGVKSVMFAGSGEPLMHPDIAAIVAHGANGLDLAITTNGSLLQKDLTKMILPHLQWIRVSLNAFTPSEYARVHKCGAGLFERVLHNLEDAVAIKQKHGLHVTIGVQCVILGPNLNGVVKMGRRLKDIGVDYFSLKPFSAHPLAINKGLGEVMNEVPEFILSELMELNGHGFTVNIRKHAISVLERRAKSYRRCLGLPFWVYIEADGEVYPCNSYLGKQEYSYGNVIHTTFRDVWLGAKARKVQEDLGAGVGPNCRLACRLEQINEFLAGLLSPPEHVNFI